FRELAKAGLLGKLAGFALLVFIFFLHRFDQRSGVDANFLRVDLPELLVIFDAVIEQRLGDGGVVDFAVPVATVGDEVDDDVAAESGAIVGCNLSYAHDGIGIFSIYVENGNGLALGDIRCKTRRMLLRGWGGEANEIVDDDLDGAADGVGLEV